MTEKAYKGVIVLDGPDAAGKSTLAAYFAEKWAAEVLHATWSKELDPVIFDYHYDLLNQAVDASTSRLVVLDRHWLSEAIYARVYRDGTKVPHEGRLFDRVLRRLGAVHVLCLPLTPERGAEAIVESASKRHEMWNASGKLKLLELCRRYDQFWYGLPRTKSPRLAPRDYAESVIQSGGAQRRADYLRYSYQVDGLDLEHFSNRVLFKLSELREAAECADFPLVDQTFNLVGSPNYCVLVCGDQLKPKHKRTRWPFIEHANSSLTLAAACHEARLDENFVAWTNVNDDDGEVAIRLLSARSPDERRVLCLGLEAAGLFTRAGLNVKVASVPHPQWARRFGKKREQPYSDELSDVIDRLANS